MKALNVPVHDTLVGLVACLPPDSPPRHRVGRPSLAFGWSVAAGDVLGVVTKCERCEGTGDADDNGWRGDCPYWLAGCNGNNGTTTCSYGCRDEPECMTCRPSEGWGPDPGPTCHDCDGTGYAPFKFVKVLDMRTLVHRGDQLGVDGIRTSALVIRDGVVAWLDGDVMKVLDLPDAKPGGMALHVEWTDCPRCEGERCPYCRGPEADYHTWCIPCPTCQTPPTVEGDAPIVEVK